MVVIRQQDARRTQTPNALMTTLASPTQGEAATAVWRVDMQPSHAGPLHSIDEQQVWTVLSGGATVQLGDDSFDLAAGDTMVLPPDAPRRITSGNAGFVAVVVASAAMWAYPLPVGDKVKPAWVV
jgi:quercetin dioxygenase-like cupin family protein